MIEATCHCGAVSIRLPDVPAEVTHCNCSICRRYGVLWGYYAISSVKFAPNPFPTSTYAWNGKNVDFHRCSTCGCVTHWSPRATGRSQLGVNMRLIDPSVLTRAKIRYKDAAGTGIFL